MKDLIVIGAYCPDEERQKLLYNCLESLSPLKKDFDFMISTHTLIPEYIANKVDYIFFDKKNELIKDWELINKPWFSPFNGCTIISALITGYSTYLAAFRIFIGAFGFAKNFKYDKVHWVEYDSYFTNYDDFYDNSKILNDHIAVQYKKEYRNYEKNLDWGYGCFQSVNIKKLDEIFIIYDEEKLLEILKNCPNKTNEKTVQEIYEINNGKVFFKNYDNLLIYNKFNLSDDTSKENLSCWAVPYYDTKKDQVCLVVWNSKQDTPMNVVFIINDDTIIPFENIKKFEWSIKDVGDINKINSITTLIGDKIKNKLIFDDELREKFKKTNYTIYE